MATTVTIAAHLSKEKEVRVRVNDNGNTVEELAMCSCGKNPAEDPHSCPYAEDIMDNDDPEYCTCCGDCRHDCAMDI